jgi:hypothetical protein
VRPLLIIEATLRKAPYHQRRHFFPTPATVLRFPNNTPFQFQTTRIGPMLREQTFA